MITLESELLYSTPDNVELSEYLNSLSSSVKVFNTMESEEIFLEKTKTLKQHDYIVVIMDYLYMIDVRDLLLKFRTFNIDLNITKLYFYESLEDIITRTGDTLYKKIYKKHHALFTSYKINQWLLLEDSNKDYTNPNCIIADMDTTICFNISGRSYYEPDLMDTDVGNLPIIGIIKNYLKCNLKSKLIVITGRTEHNCKEVTEKFLYYTFPEYRDRIKLYMRGYDDRSHAYEYKEKLVKENVLPFYNVDFALDDDPRIINAYHNLGITALLVNHLGEG